LSLFIAGCPKCTHRPALECNICRLRADPASQGQTLDDVSDALRTAALQRWQCAMFVGAPSRAAECWIDRIVPPDLAECKYITQLGVDSPFPVCEYLSRVQTSAHANKHWTLLGRFGQLLDRSISIEWSRCCSTMSQPGEVNVRAGPPWPPLLSKRYSARSGG
jgi:hypothetical protein